MDKLLKWVVIGILCALKLIMTGLFIGLGFKVCNMIMAKHERRWNEKLDKASASIQ
jgi:hypothetical protein